MVWAGEAAGIPYSSFHYSPHKALHAPPYRLGLILGMTHFYIFNSKKKRNSFIMQELKR